MHDQLPKQPHKSIDDDAKVLPTRDNPEFIPLEDGVRHVFPVPRNDKSGNRAMYEFARYFDEEGNEQVVLLGTAEEKFPDGRVGIPKKTLSRERIDAIKEQNAQQLRAALARRAAAQVGIASPESTPDERSAQGSSLIEFDGNGMIIVPDSVKNPGSRIPDRSEKIESSVDPLDELDEDVRAEVLSYRRAVQNKRDAEAAKNYALAAEDGRAIYRVEQSLSPAARAFLKLR